MITTFSEYQNESKKTTMYSRENGIGIMYIALGLAGEHGEIIEKIKQFIQSKGEVFDNFKLELTKEIGDLMWYISQLCTETGLELSKVASQILKNEVDILDKYDEQIQNTQFNSIDIKLEYICIDMTITISKLVEKIKKIIRNKNGNFDIEDIDIINKILATVFSNIRELIVLFSLSIKDILNLNIQKITSRLNRGVIKSEGDNR